MKRKNFSDGNTVMADIVFDWKVITAIVMGILIFMFGTTSLFYLIKFLSQPVTSGSIPVWSIFVVGILFIIYLRRR